MKILLASVLTAGSNSFISIKPHYKDGADFFWRLIEGMIQDKWESHNPLDNALGN